jgi:hypothetical protein
MILFVQDQPDKLSSDIPPCSTLFVANLGHSCTEEELKEVLSKQPGFHLLKMRRRGGMPVAFADFTVYLPLLFLISNHACSYEML